MQNKNKRHENKIMLGALNYAMDKIDRDGENKTQRFYRCCSNYALSMGKGELRFPEFICYNRSFAKDQYRPSILIFGKGRIEADELGRIWVLPSP